jgi:hypothetical protein
MGLRATWRASDGRVQFFTSTNDGQSWQQLGSDAAFEFPPASINAGTAPLWIGVRDDPDGNQTNRFAGRVRRAEVRDGIDGTVVASPDFRTVGDGWEDGDDSLTAARNDDQGNAWSLQGDAEVESAWVDLSSRLRAPVTWAYGRQTELDRVETGTGSLVLGNVDRALDPNHDGSPYYPYVRPMVRVQLTAVHDATTYDVFEGYAEAWQPRWIHADTDATVIVRVVDGLELLQQARTSAGYDQATSGTRIGALLDAADWPVGKRDLDPGQSDVQAYTASDRIVGNALKDTAATEDGIFFVAPDGDATSRDRLSLVVGASQVTLGDSGSEMRYRALEPDYSVERLYNDVSVTPDGLSVQRARDDPSHRLYGLRSLLRDGTLHVTELEASDAAHWLLRRYREPRQRIDAVELMGHRDADDTLEQILSRTLGDRVLVRRRPPGGGDPIEIESVIEHVQHTIAETVWTTVWRLSPASTETVWLLETPGASELEESTYAGY